mgnify:CR=1 FL=1
MFKKGSRFACCYEILNAMDKKTIVIGVIGADAHAVGNKIIDLTLNNSGFNVVNLGVMVSQEEFIDAAVETNADAILVSSLYGHGEIDCMGLREKCNEAAAVLFQKFGLTINKSVSALVFSFSCITYETISSLRGVTIV